MKKWIVIRLALAFSITILLGRLDDESHSIADVFAMENWPAIFIYTAIIFLALTLAWMAVNWIRSLST